VICNGSWFAPQRGGDCVLNRPFEIPASNPERILLWVRDELDFRDEG
jgi:hypothetical protein